METQNRGKNGKHQQPHKNLGQVAAEAIARTRSHTTCTVLTQPAVDSYAGAVIANTTTSIAHTTTKSTQHTASSTSTSTTTTTSQDKPISSPFQHWGSLAVQMAKTKATQQKNPPPETHTTAQGVNQPLKSLPLQGFSNIQSDIEDHMDTQNTEDDQSFQSVKPRKPKRPHSSKSNSPNSSYSSPKPNTPDETKKKKLDIDDLSLFITGKSENIANAIKKQPIKFEKDLTAAIGIVENIIPNYQKGYLRIYPKNHKQRQEILKLTKIGSCEVLITEPFALHNKNQTSKHNSNTGPTPPQALKGVIRGVSTELTDDEIQSTTGAQYVNRIQTYSHGIQSPSTTVILSFTDTDTLPDKVKIGLIYYKVDKYIPNPIRCDKCQKFGHTTKNCRATVPVCSYCSGDHTYNTCPNKEQLAKCANCGGNHSAAYKKCPKFQECKETLKLKTKHNITYQAASDLMKSFSAPALPEQISHQKSRTKSNGTSGINPKNNTIISENSFKAPLRPSKSKHKVPRTRTSTENTPNNSPSKPENLNPNKQLHLLHTKVLGVICDSLAFIIENIQTESSALRSQCSVVAVALHQQVTELKLFLQS